MVNFSKNYLFWSLIFLVGTQCNEMIMDSWQNYLVDGGHQLVDIALKHEKREVWSKVDVL